MPDIIYVVDDNEINLKMVSTALRRAGYDVGTARSAVGVLVEIGTVHPSLAILDVMMPDIDEHLKAFKAGADDFIAKPFTPQELQALAKVGEVILLATATPGR